VTLDVHDFGRDLGFGDKSPWTPIAILVYTLRYITETNSNNRASRPRVSLRDELMAVKRND